MPLIKRLVKGSPLTFQEGDDNLDYLENLALSSSVSFNNWTGSSASQFAGTASFATNAITASYPIALTGSTIYSIGTDAGGPGFNFNTTYRNIFLGFEAGMSASNAFQSNFIGDNAGKFAVNTGYANFIGWEAGYSASNADESNFIGVAAGYQAISANLSNFIGSLAGQGATNSNYSNFIGYAAGRFSPSAYSSNFIGPGAGASANNAYRSNFIGDTAGSTATNAYHSTFIGYFSGDTAAEANHSVFIGKYAGRSSISASYSVLLGKAAGAPGNIWDNTRTIGRNNIIIGTNITLEPGRRDSINLGGIIFATGSYFPSVNPEETNIMFSGSAGGRVGINVVNPTFTLDVSGSGRYTNGLTTTGSLNISGSLNVNGTITATTLVVQTVTSSQSWITGSTKFGSLSSNTHEFTGSVSITGSSTTNGISTFSQVTGYNNSTTDGAIVLNNPSSGHSIALGVTSDSYLRIKGPRIIHVGAASNTQFVIEGAYISSFNSSPGLRLGTGISTSTVANNNSIYVSDSVTIGNTSHSYNMLRLFSPISSSVINGLARGVYISPTFSGSVDFRAIQWDNSSNFGLYGSGSAPNVILGSTTIGSLSTGSATFNVVGTTNLNGNTTLSGSLSISSSAGTTLFSSNADTLIFTGSASITGSLGVKGGIQAGAFSLGTTAGNKTSRILASDFTATNNVTYSFVGYRTANGSDWFTSALGINLNVDATDVGVITHITRTGNVFANDGFSTTNGAISAGSDAFGGVFKNINAGGTAGAIPTTAGGFAMTGTSNANISNYGIYINNTSTVSGTGRKWGLYSNAGTNYFNDNILIGTTTDAGQKLQVNGDALIAGATFNANAGLGQLSIGVNVGTNAASSTYIGTNVGQQSNGAGVRHNVGVGQGAIQLARGEGNTALGYLAMAGANVYAGNWNTAVGWQALLTVLTGINYNTAVGTNAGYGISTGTYNTFLGGNLNTYTGSGITTGNYNVLIGSQITGLTSSLSNTIILADGQGNQRIRVSDAGNTMIATTTDAGYKLYVSGSGTSGSLNVDNTLHVNSSRNVLIGTTTDAGDKLQINGRTRSTSFYGTTGDNYLNATGGGTVIGGTLGPYDLKLLVFGKTAFNSGQISVSAFNTYNGVKGFTYGIFNSAFAGGNVETSTIFQIGNGNEAYSYGTGNGYAIGVVYTDSTGNGNFLGQNNINGLLFKVRSPNAYTTANPCTFLNGDVTLDASSTFVGTQTVYGFKWKLVSSHTPTVQWAIYAETGNNYFGGNVAIGTTNTSASLTVSGSVAITGSLSVSGSITGSLLGTASFATTASYALSTVQPTSGKVIYVDASSPNATNTRGSLSKYNLTYPFLTIQAAVNAAASGDSIWVYPGTYNESILIGPSGSVALNMLLYSGVTINGGSSYAIYVGTSNYCGLNIDMMSNSIIRNTGNASDPSGSAVLQKASNSGINITGLGNPLAKSVGANVDPYTTGNPSIISTNAYCMYNFGSADFNGEKVSGITFYSQNSIPIVNGNGMIYENCMIYAPNNYGIYISADSFINCLIVSNKSCLYNPNSCFNHFMNCNLYSTNEYGIYGGNWTNRTVLNNCRINSFSQSLFLSTNNTPGTFEICNNVMGSRNLASNDIVTITNTNASSTGIFSNNVVNKSTVTLPSAILEVNTYITNDVSGSIPHIIT